MTAATTANEKKAPQRSKRLRKKLFQDEFATFGFELECEFKNDLTDETISQFVDSFLSMQSMLKTWYLAAAYLVNACPALSAQANATAQPLKPTKQNCLPGSKRNHR
jgi:uncharacterized protein YggL (DUF469 family)